MLTFNELHLRFPYFVFRLVTLELHFVSGIEYSFLLFLRAEGYDVVSFHSYCGWIVSLLRILVREYRRIKIITSFHGLETLYYDELATETARSHDKLSLRFRAVHGFLMLLQIRIACRGSDLVECRNKREVERVTRDRWADPDRVLLIPNGVPASFFIERESSRDVRRLLFVGQWRDMKGIRYLVEAFV